MSPASISNAAKNRIESKEKRRECRLTLSMILVSDIVGTAPVHRANLHWSPSICSVTPISAIYNI